MLSVTGVFAAFLLLHPHLDLLFSGTTVGVGAGIGADVAVAVLLMGLDAPSWFCASLADVPCMFNPTAAAELPDPPPPAPPPRV